MRLQRHSGLFQRGEGEEGEKENMRSWRCFSPVRGRACYYLCFSCVRLDDGGEESLGVEEGCDPVRFLVFVVFCVI